MIPCIKILLSLLTHPTSQRPTLYCRAGIAPVFNKVSIRSGLNIDINMTTAHIYIANGERNELAFYKALHEHLSDYGHKIN